MCKIRVIHLWFKIGKGLSKYQKAVLEALNRRGFLTVYDVDDAVWEFKSRGDKDFPMLKALRSGIRGEVKTIRNYTALYRLMKSLVKRKLARRVLHVRPTVWIKLEDGDPSIETLMRNMKLWSLVMEKRLIVEIGNEIKVYRMEESNNHETV